MEISPLMLAKLLLYSFFFGISIGVFYDFNRIIRIFFGVRYAKRRFERVYSLKLPIVKKSLSIGADKGARKFTRGVVIFVGDFVTLVGAAVGAIILNYAYNDGSFRGFTLIGIALGFLIYFFTLGKLVMLISEPVAFLIKYCLCSAFIVLVYPFKLFFQILIKNGRKMCFLCRFTLEKRRKKVYNIKERVCLLEMAKNGFLQQELSDDIESGTEKSKEV